MLWLFAIGFAAYALVSTAARESWERRSRGPGAKPARCGLTGEEVARTLVAEAGLGRIPVAKRRTEESARFSARTGRITLGHSVYHGRDVAAVFLAALAVAEAVTPEDERPARAMRRLVTGFLHPLVGWGLAVGILVAVFRPVLWRPLLVFWLCAGLALLAGHLGTLAWEYRVGERAIALLRGRGWIAPGEEGDFEAVRSDAALRDVKSLGASLRKAVFSLLPAGGWR